MNPSIENSWVTSIVKKVDGNRNQRGVAVRVTTDRAGPAFSVKVRSNGSQNRIAVSLPEPAAKSQRVLLYLPEQPDNSILDVHLLGGESIVDAQQLRWQQKPVMAVHLVHSSHHDIGYTDVPSSIYETQAKHLSDAVEFARDTDSYPHESQFRITIEQAWSLEEFMRRGSDAERKEMIRLLRQGRFEVTALSGNMISELLGHEGLYRSLLPAARLAAEYGFSITTAEHNDIPGLAWGLAEVLADCGVKLFCPSMPRYYDWGTFPMRSFWDDEVMEPNQLPRAFLWEAPSGRKLLVWHAPTQAVGGSVRPEFSWVIGTILDLEERGYALNTVRCKIFGGMSDNSPYAGEFSPAVRSWDEAWVSPRLLMSTNAMFCDALLAELPHDIPVARGELPGQDYPLGALSTAMATTTNRTSKQTVIAGEQLASFATLATTARYPADKISAAWRDILLHDEHTWGYHFPCGPAVAAFEHEKAVHAFRGAALARDVLDKSMAALFDMIDRDQNETYLVVYNPTSADRSDLVSIPMRAIDCMTIDLAKVDAEDDPEGAGYLRGVLLGHRWHANPPEEMYQAGVEVVDVSTGVIVSAELAHLTDPMDPVEFADGRIGIGTGANNYGTPVSSAGLLHELRFVAAAVPPFGYRLFRLRPAEGIGQAARPTRSNQLVAESPYFRVVADPKDGSVSECVDTTASAQLIDPECEYGFADLIVHDPVTDAWECAEYHTTDIVGGEVSTVLRSVGGAYGHPKIVRTITVYGEIEAVDVAIRVLKDPTPLLDVHLAFPFLLEDPEFIYDSGLAPVRPLHDFLPGAYFDTVAVQEWVSVANDHAGILVSSRDTPIVQFSQLSSGRVSPAHRCYMTEAASYDPPDSLPTGWLFATLFANNFSTNFSPSQIGSVLFRFRISTTGGSPEISELARRGAANTNPFLSLYLPEPGPQSGFPRPPKMITGGRETGLPPSGSFLEIEGDPLIVTAFKQKENGDGYLVRLWNRSRSASRSVLKFPFWHVVNATMLDGIERTRSEGADARVQMESGLEGHGIRVELPPCTPTSVGVWFTNDPPSV